MPNLLSVLRKKRVGRPTEAGAYYGTVQGGKAPCRVHVPESLLQPSCAPLTLTAALLLVMQTVLDILVTGDHEVAPLLTLVLLPVARVADLNPDSIGSVDPDPGGQK